MGASVAASVAVIAEMVAQEAQLAKELSSGFEQHRDAQVVRSLPGLGTVLGARVLGEFGDEPDRYASAKSRKNYAGTSPITRASGTKKAVLARHVRNRRLADAIYLWAFSSLTAQSVPGPTTMPAERPATATTKPYVPLVTVSWASFMVAFHTTPPTTRTSPGGTTHGAILLTCERGGVSRRANEVPNIPHASGTGIKRFRPRGWTGRDRSTGWTAG